VEERKSDYYVALRRSQKGEGIKAWLQFFLSLTLKQSQTAIALLSQDYATHSLSPKQLLVKQCLVKHGELTAGEITRHTNIARPTVNQALRKLLQLKIIIRLGEGRSTRYRLSK
jgi:DNA-binding MarR family transcriptional regulator